MAGKIETFDTTLRDGTQGEGVNLSLEDKLRIAQRLDDFGIDFIEGGWPGSNPKDIGFFQRAKDVQFKHAKLCAFGSTRHARNKVEEDPNVCALIEAETAAVSIFGKTWDLHVTNALRIKLEDNLDMIRDTVRFLKENGRIVIYDAEHFFDGYKNNPDYALQTVKAACEAGADVLAFCDTNGGTMPHEITEIVTKMRNELDGALGIHAHNDAGCGIANSLAAIKAGCTHVQGTFNGFGERCGNADLSSVLPNLMYKMGYDVIEPEQMQTIAGLSMFISELANVPLKHNQPFVGMSAFAHKGGIHVSAVQRDSKTYEHIDPAMVGNRQRILVSELSGQSNIFHMLKNMGIEVDKSSPVAKNVLTKVKSLENEGYFFEAAEASLELLIRKELGEYNSHFDMVAYRVLVDQHSSGDLWSEATVRLTVDGDSFFMAGEGDGPVNALDNALRKALLEKYPQLSEVRLTDFKVRIIDTGRSTAAKTRVMIESTDGVSDWITIGVSENIIEASWEALVDSIEYKLLLDDKAK
ncbi:MAG: citramalate synthase [Candidatus Hinthialibacter antarcticus]|nr:citramalate synthase [Candidatus Hinthialibacter antarcticus]